MIVTPLLVPLEDLEAKTQQDEMPLDLTIEYTTEDDPIIPPFSPPG